MYIVCSSINETTATLSATAILFSFFFFSDELKLCSFDAPVIWAILGRKS